MFFPRVCLLLLVCLIVFSCGGSKDKEPKGVVDAKKYTSFRGNYRDFNDLADKHLASAQAKGIDPMGARADTLKNLDALILMPNELDLYRMDKLTHSLPYLVPDAAELLVKIGFNFKDSLRSKDMPRYKLVITSVTRTVDDVKKLSKGNVNASSNSAHTYGTTFDISWKRFQKIGPSDDEDVSSDKLKLILAQVLHDLRERGYCYVVHERKQACFHITVR